MGDKKRPRARAVRPFPGFCQCTEDQRCRSCENAARFQTLLENLRFGVYRYCVHTKRLVHANPAMLRLFGFDSLEEMADADPEALYGCSGDRAKIYETFRRCGRVGEYTLPLRRRDGSIFMGSYTGVAHVDDDGRIDWIDGSLEDVTARLAEAQRLVHYQERLRALTTELTVTEERERLRIATALHDDVVQLLAVVKLRLGECSTANFSEKTQAISGEIRSLIDQAIRSARDLTTELSPPVLTQLGFAAGVSWLVEQVRERHRLEAHFRKDRGDLDLSPELGVILFRAVSELLTNVVKHAHAKRVSVNLRRLDNQIDIVVRDDGCGLAPDWSERSLSSSGGFGLFAIRERVRHYGGVLEVLPCPEGGVQVRVAVPLNPARPLPPA